MTAPVRSASVSPFAAARPQVHSRRVSLRVGPFGLTYSTNRLLWDGLQGVAGAAEPLPADQSGQSNQADVDAAPVDRILGDPPPVDAAPAVESERPQTRSESSTFPLDLEAARKRSLWAAAQGQAVSQIAGQTEDRQTSAESVGVQGLGATQTQGTDPLAAAPPQPEQVFGPVSGASAQTGQPGRKATLAQAMRQATQAYLACAAGFACPRPMLQAVA